MKKEWRFLTFRWWLAHFMKFTIVYAAGHTVSVSDLRQSWRSLTPSAFLIFSRMERTSSWMMQVPISESRSL